LNNETFSKNLQALFIFTTKLLPISPISIV